MKDITITLDGAKLSVPEGACAGALDHKARKLPITAARINGKLSPLTQTLHDGDEVKLLDIRGNDAHRIYLRGLRFLMKKAAKDMFPGMTIDIQHTIGEGFYFEKTAGDMFTYAELTAIKNRMCELVAEDLPFVEVRMNKFEAMRLYERNGEASTARILRFKPEDICTAYMCGDTMDYYYGYMPRSSGILTKFDLILMPPGAILIFPCFLEPEAPLEFVPRPKRSAVFSQSENRGRMLDCTCAADLNEIVERGELPHFILVNEGLHDKAIAEIADKACNSKKRIVLIAGPSSSGKTTFAQRLSVQIQVNGLKPTVISLDNYYRNRAEIKPDKNGKLDLENISTLDLELLDEQLNELLVGKAVELPVYDFSSGMRRPGGELYQLHADNVLILEGIHALNENIAPTVERDMTYKIYLSALTQLNLDNHNHIPSADVRLLRRLVRDKATRGASFEHTFEMWNAVRDGEAKWITPFQENSDVMFDSSLIYELLYLKKYTIAGLREVPETSPYFSEAKRLMSFLSYFVDPGYDDIVPSNSLLREFLGRGCFRL
jgi:uridine kinase